MKTIRRIYVYAVSLVSFLVTTWAIIGLLRSIFDTSSIPGSTGDLAQALSMILVGGFVFYIHWRMAQMDAEKDAREQNSLVRALFLYGTWAALLTPIVQNILALLFRSLISMFDISVPRYGFGLEQIASDNLIAIFVNAVLALYIYTFIKKHWLQSPPAEAFITVRRIFRYVWSLYALGMVLIGLQMVISYLLNAIDLVDFGANRDFVWGLSSLIVGLPLWLQVWNIIQEAAKSPEESQALLRQAILYVASLVSLVVSLTALGVVISQFLQSVFIARIEFSSFLSQVEEMVSVGIPALIVWQYFSRVLKQDQKAVPSLIRRSGMRRLYCYALAFVGLAATFTGLEMLVMFFSDLLFGSDRLVSFGLDVQLINTATLLLLGIPVWLLNWLPMNREANLKEEAGDHARRSLVRRSYLYLLLFFGVIGVMFITGSLLFLIISTLLGDPPPNVPQFLTQVLGSLVFFSLLTYYHWIQLRQDNSTASQALSEKHAAFAVGIFDHVSPDFQALLKEEFAERLPSMPVRSIPPDAEIPKSKHDLKAVVVNGQQLLSLPGPAREWLASFAGAILVVPSQDGSWIWPGAETLPADKAAKKLVQHIEKLAEQEEGDDKTRSPWVYILIALIGLPFICGIVNLIVETAF